LYTGVTNDLVRRVFEHKDRQNPNSFTAKYKLEKLVYFESCQDSCVAIGREKQIKAGSRAKKIQLVVSNNPEWKDLTEMICS